MGHSLHRIWIHGIFSTKYRQPIIRESFEVQLYSQIKDKLENELDCRVKIINGTKDHTHILFVLSPNYSIRDIFQIIKGGSSHFINQSNFVRYKFAWQTGYAAFSVSKSHVSRVESYIANQKEHHRKKTFSEEFDWFIENYGIKGVNP